MVWRVRALTWRCAPDDEQVGSKSFGLSSPSQAALLYHRLATDGADAQCKTAHGSVPCRPEGVPTIWNNRSRQGRDAVPKGGNKRRQVHFRNRAFAVIQCALDEGLMKQWTSSEGAAKEITDGLEEVGNKLKVPGQIVSSRSGRQTGGPAGMEMGAPATSMSDDSRPACPRIRSCKPTRMPIECPAK